MKIFNDEMTVVGDFEKRLVAELPLKADCLNWEKAELWDLDDLIIPYTHQELKDEVIGLIFDIAEENEWRYPDIENSSLSMVFHESNSKVELFIQTQPPKYTKEKKAEILSKCDNVTDADGYNEYEDWQYVFEMADAFHKGDLMVSGDYIMELYEVELSEDELYVLNRAQSYMQEIFESCLTA